MVERCLSNSAVTNVKVLDGAITQNKLSTSPPAVITATILDTNVTEAKSVDSGCTSDKIASSAILNTHLGSGCVQTESIGDAQISTLKCIDGFCTT